MTKVDLFESVFRSADKPAFIREVPSLGQALLVADLDDAQSAALLGQVRSFLSAAQTDTTRWDVLGADGYDTVQGLLERVEEIKPDLIVTYRHLKSNAWQWPYSLGEYLD